MKPEFTQQQSLQGLQHSERLSLEIDAPPAKLPGYELERLLGQGAFGQVWLGTDLNTGRQVAVKFYLHVGGVDWSLLSQEVKHLVTMSTGRYVVQVLAVGWDAKPPYYVMEYLEHGSLDDMIRERGVMSVSDTVSMFREIADGLCYAHAKGVLHCDLKPANVLLDHTSRPRLADFGQSRMSDDQRPSLGTLFFMAPEQADLTAAPDAAWDVYALGAIAYTMLTGVPPYRTPEAVSQLDTAHSLPERLKRYQASIRFAPRPKLHYRSGVDKALCNIIDRCLAPRPEQRYQNVQQVVAAIDSRNRARSRRPLMIMAFIGPLILLALMFLFSNRSIAIAKRESLQRVQQLYLRGNLQTAKYAKTTMEGEIKSLFQLVQREAGRRELRERLTAAVQANTVSLTALANASSLQKFDEITSTLEQQQLHRYLETRIQAMIVKDGLGDGIAVFNSLFVNESQGTNMGIAFANPEEELDESPVGRNFAYRSYFNGLREDGDKALMPDRFSPVRAPHLSASFRSTSTGQWKLGVSAPIWPEETSFQVEQGLAPDPQAKPLGVLVLTVNLGDFVLLSTVASGVTQFTTLVDGRPGNQKGTLLQHPLIEDMDKSTMLKTKMPQMNEMQFNRLLLSDGIVDYVDPAGAFPDGEDFKGTWIAAMAQVHVPASGQEAGRGVKADQLTSPAADIAEQEKLEAPSDEAALVARKSDLWVLVQESSSIVSAPVNELGSRLQRESYKALAALLALIIVLWFFVLRFGLRINGTMLSPSDHRSPSSLQSLLRRGSNISLESTIDSDR